MAGRGPAPMEPESRRRPKNGKTPGQTVVAADGVTRGPELPARRSNGQPWPDVTLAWWATYRRSPQAQLWSDTDWMSHMVTADLHAAFWGDGEAKHAAELRLREARMGATYEDRLRLRIRVDDGPVSAGLASVKSLPSYKDRLSGGSA